MNKIPSAWQQSLPGILHAVAVACALFATGAKDDPELYNSLGLPAGALALITTAAGVVLGQNNLKSAAAALPPAPTDDRGQPLDELTHLLALAAAAAVRAGDVPLQKHLANRPQDPHKS